MKDERKTKKQLVEELVELRQRIAELEKSEAERQQVEAQIQAEKAFTDTALDAQLDTFFLFEPTTGKALRWNRAFGEITGYTDEEIADLPAPASYYGPEDLERAVVFMQQVLAEGTGTIELALICKDGRRIPTEYRVSVINDDQGEARYIISIGRDITERKRAEEQLLTLSSVVEQSSDAVVVLDLEEVIEYVNKEFLEWTGFRLEEIVGTNWRSFLARFPFLKSKYPEIREAIVEGGMWRGEIAESTESGESAWREIRVFPIKDADGRITRSVCLRQDITERKQMENLVYAQRDLGLALGAAIGLGKILRLSTEAAIRASEMDCGGVYLVDKASGSLTLAFHKGLPPDFVKKTSYYDADSANARLIMTGKPIYTRHQELGVPFDEVRHRESLKAIAIIPVYHEDQVIACLNIASHTLDEVPSYARAALETIANQIGGAIARSEAENALRESEDKFTKAFHSSPILMAIAKVADGHIIDVNSSYCSTTGYRREELVGSSTVGLGLWVEPETSNNIAKALQEQGRVHDLEVLIRTKSGETRSLLLAGEIVDLGGESHLIAVANDITERKQMEEQLKKYAKDLERLVRDQVHRLEEERAKVIHTSKLAALGQMASGVAHELNQPLTAILFEGEYLKRMIRPPEGEQVDSPSLDVDELYQMAEDITNDVTRCTHIINHLRTFSRISNQEPKPIILNQPIEDSFILINQRLREHAVEIKLELDPELPLILADSHRLEQVFLNLMTNAEYGMEEMARRVEAGEVEHPSYQKRLEISSFVEGDSVVAVVRDNGIGIPEADQKHIFEPFFTTKPVGEGTGLGLSISYGIVTDFGGEITFESAENEGTIFTLQFPVASG